MYTDVDARGVPRTIRVLPIEDRDAAFQAVLDGAAHPGLAHFHQLLEREFAGISHRQAARWYAESANHQLHARIKSKSVVRPVISRSPLRHLQCNLTGHRSKRGASSIGLDRSKYGVKSSC